MNWFKRLFGKNEKLDLNLYRNKLKSTKLSFPELKEVTEKYLKQSNKKE
jgi:hypothetical protein